MKRTGLLLLAVLLVFLSGCGSETTTTKPKLIQLPEYKLLTLRQKGPYEKMNGAFGQLFAQSGKLQAKPAGVPFAIYYNDPEKVKPAEYDWEVCVPVNKKVKPEPPVMFRVQPKMEAVSVTYTGDYGTKAHMACYTTLMEYGKKLDGYKFSGPPREVYFEIKGFRGGKKNVTQIYFPVAKK